MSTTTKTTKTVESALKALGNLDAGQTQQVLGWLADRDPEAVIKAIEGIAAFDAKATPSLTGDDAADTFARGLNVRHGDDGKRVFGVDRGRVYDKITVASHGQMSVHAFVKRATGEVLKASGWTAPAKGVRFANVFAALDASDPFGSYLYQR